LTVWDVAAPAEDIEGINVLSVSFRPTWLADRLRQGIQEAHLMTDGYGMSFTDSLKGEERRKFYERHRSIAIAMILIVFLFPFAGLYVTGLFGAVLGVVVSVGLYYLTPYVWLTLLA
jgi:hypothetical protein